MFAEWTAASSRRTTSRACSAVTARGEVPCEVFRDVAVVAVPVASHGRVGGLDRLAVAAGSAEPGLVLRVIRSPGRCRRREGRLPGDRSRI